MKDIFVESNRVYSLVHETQRRVCSKDCTLNHIFLNRNAVLFKNPSLPFLLYTYSHSEFYFQLNSYFIDRRFGLLLLGQWFWYEFPFPILSFFYIKKLLTYVESSSVNFLSFLLHSAVCVFFRFTSFPFLSLFCITPFTVAHRLLRNSGMEFENRAMLFINQNLLRVKLKSAD